MITFNFDKANRRWQKQWFRATGRAQALDKLEDDQQNPIDLINFLDDIDALAAQVIESVAPEALLAGAPDSIDWSDPESLDLYIRADVDVATLLTEAFMETSGNSQGG